MKIGTRRTAIDGVHLESWGRLWGRILEGHPWSYSWHGKIETDTWSRGDCTSQSWKQGGRGLGPDVKSMERTY